LANDSSIRFCASAARMRATVPKGRIPTDIARCRSTTSSA
jgi:hypothetical protein